MSFDQSNSHSISALQSPWLIRLRILFFSPFFVSLLVAIITLLTFSRVLSADFVKWDDDRMIYDNPNLDGFTPKRLKRIFTQVDVTRRYTPLAALHYTIAYQLFKLNPLGYHLGAWLFHGANAVLVFLVLRKFLVIVFSRRTEEDIDYVRINVGSGLGALVWSLHPLRVEPVAWAGASFYPQAMFFLLLSLFYYLHANELAYGQHFRRRRLTASVIFFAASLLSHPIGICFFIVLIVLDVYPLGRIRGGRQWYGTPATRQALWEKLPFAAAGVLVLFVTAIIRLTSPQAITEPVSLAEFGLSERIMQALYIWAYYFWRPWYPLNLMPVYTTLTAFEPFSLPFIASGTGVILCLALLLLLWRRWPLGLMLGICHLVVLLPVLGLLEHPYYHNDRYSMIVSLCWSGLLASLLVNPKIRRKSFVIFFAIVIIATAALGVLSFRQTHVWNNSVALFEHILKLLGDDPYQSDICSQLGEVLIEQERINYAIDCFEKTLESNPDHARAHHYLANALVKKGRIQRAISHYAKAAQVEPNLAEAHQNLGVLLFAQNRLDEAVGRFYRALDVKPEYSQALENLELILAIDEDSKLINAGKLIKYAERAAESTGYQDAKVLKALSAAYAAEGRFDQAMKIAARALELAVAAEQKELAGKIRMQIQFYELGRPYRNN
jgi:tetratricopeptide (TPR) repeat protein